MVSVWARGMVDWGVSLVWVDAGLWLPQGGVAHCWAGEPAGWSTSIGVAVGGLVDAAVAYERGGGGHDSHLCGGSGRVRVHGSGGGSLGMFGGSGFDCGGWGAKKG